MSYSFRFVMHICDFGFLQDIARMDDQILNKPLQVNICHANVSAADDHIIGQRLTGNGYCKLLKAETSTCTIAMQSILERILHIFMSKCWSKT